MKNLRLRRLFQRERFVLVPLDHGVRLGPIPGLESPRRTVQELIETGYVDALQLYRGTLKRLAPLLAPYPDIATIVQLGGSVELGPRPVLETLVSSVEEALALGADAVSLRVNLGNEHDTEMLRNLGVMAERCDHWGMPLLAKMSLLGRHHPRPANAPATAARIAMELGADLVEIDCPTDHRVLPQIIAGVEIPVLLAGGRPEPDLSRFLSRMHLGLRSGARGLAVGRNLFGRRDRARVLEALHQLVHHDASVAEALRHAQR